jgi:hypothetical protein
VFFANEVTACYTTAISVFTVANETTNKGWSFADSTDTFRCDIDRSIC